MTQGWYIAKIQRGKESALQVGLSLHNVEAYNPEIIGMKRGRGRWEPLFPTYLFCYVDPESEQWPQVRWARGLRYFLGADRKPTPIAASLVDEIRARVEVWNGGGWASAFEPGTRVHIGDGALSGLEAIFTRYLPGRHRCEVLISLVGRTHTVQLPTTSVEALQPVALLG